MAQFSDPFARRNAEQKMFSIRQGNCSAQDYIAEFRRLAALTHFNDSALTSAFHNGLNDAVQDVIALSPNRPDDELSPYMAWCTQLDQRLSNRAQQNKNFNGYSNSPFSSGIKPSGFIKQSGYRRRNYLLHAESNAKSTSITMSDDPIKPNDDKPPSVPAASGRRTVSDVERKWCQDTNACLYCGGNDHLLEHCTILQGRSKN